MAPNDPDDVEEPNESPEVEQMEEANEPDNDNLPVRSSQTSAL